MMRSQHQNIIATVSYADIFDYPLTKREIATWCIGGSCRVSPLPFGLERIGAYVVLSGRKHLAKIREVRQHIAAAKWKHIRKIAMMFRYVPTVLLVGVTGGLAVDNANECDDIDLFFVTQKNTLWTTRMLVTIFADRMRIRRRPNDTYVSDKICLNMFMSEDALRLPTPEHDLFAAHEVIQMVPLWEREGIYKKFLDANRWVKKFVPNAWKEKVRRERLPAGKAGKTVSEKKINILRSAFYLLFVLFEPLAQVAQLWYMKNKRTNEVIRSGMIRFHPRDARVWVREKYALRLKLWDIPLDNIFYRS